MNTPAKHKPNRKPKTPAEGGKPLSTCNPTPMDTAAMAPEAVMAMAESMSFTLFILKIAGPVALIYGISLLLNSSFFKDYIEEFRKSNTLIMFGGAANLILGLIIVLNHNLWGSLPEGIVSFIGWAAIAKGISFSLFPRHLPNMVKAFEKKEFMMAMGIIVLLLGGYITHLAYMA